MKSSTTVIKVVVGRKIKRRKLERKLERRQKERLKKINVSSIISQ